MGLGAYPTIGLANMWATVIEAQWLTVQGVDPIENRRQRLITEHRDSKTATFEIVIEFSAIKRWQMSY